VRADTIWQRSPTTWCSSGWSSTSAAPP